MRKIADMVGVAVGREEVARVVRANLILRAWPEIVGAGLAERSHPDKFERGTVWVAVEGSAWAQELRMMKEVILKRLQAMSGENGLFIDVRFGVRPIKPIEAVETAIPQPIPRPVGSIREIAERRLREWKEPEGVE